MVTFAVHVSLIILLKLSLWIRKITHFVSVPKRKRFQTVLLTLTMESIRFTFAVSVNQVSHWKMFRPIQDAFQTMSLIYSALSTFMMPVLTNAINATLCTFCHRSINMMEPSRTAYLPVHKSSETVRCMKFSQEEDTNANNAHHQSASIDTASFWMEFRLTDVWTLFQSTSSCVQPTNIKANCMNALNANQTT